MSVFRRPSTYACLPLRSKIHQLSSRLVGRTMCGSSSRPRLTSLMTPNFLFTSLDRQQRCRYIHPRCSTSPDLLVTQKSPFQEMMSFRLKQAKCSAIITLSSKNDIPCVFNLCKDYGEVKNMIVFVDKQYKFQVIAEFVHEESVQRLLAVIGFKNVTEEFPCQSRCLYFESKGRQQHADITSGELIDLSLETNHCSSKGPFSVSETIVKLYEREKMSDLSTRLRFLSCVMLQDALTGMFPHCTTFPYGSSVNGLGNDNSDLDIMLRFFQEEQVSKNSELFFHTKWANGNYHEFQQHAIRGLRAMLQNFFPGVSHLNAVIEAKVPIINYHHKLLNLQCDVSVNNMAAICISEILFFCGELDPRVHPLMYTVKKWAKTIEATIEVPEPRHQITSFSLNLLVLFFLQARQIPILPPLDKLIRVPLADYKSCTVEYVNEEGSKSLIGKNSESLGYLLQEFFNFLAGFPFSTEKISVNTGTSSSRKDGYAMCVEYPLGEPFNTAKNVTPDELQKLCKSAHVAAENLERNSKNEIETSDLMAFLGASGLKQDSSHKISVQTSGRRTFQTKNK